MTGGRVAGPSRTAAQPIAPAGSLTPSVSVCIVSFNTRELVKRCIRAATADCADLDAEIIVVDNGSRDGSAVMVRKRFPAVRLIENAENRFYAAANNQAIGVSRGRHVLVLNSDAEVGAGAIPAMVAYLDAHPAIGAISADMRFPDGRRQLNCARFASFAHLLAQYTLLGLVFAGWRRRLVADLRYGDWDRASEREVDVVPGSLMMVRREAIVATQGFDERLRLYFTDDDWCWRIRQAGFRVVYVPVGATVHREMSSARQVPRLARRLYFEDMARYAELRFGRWRARTLWVLAWPTRVALAGAARLRRS
jgi:GT2 family glycosyltransferase